MNEDGYNRKDCQRLFWNLLLARVSIPDNHPVLTQSADKISAALYTQKKSTKALTRSQWVSGRAHDSCCGVCDRENLGSVYELTSILASL